MSFFKGYVPTKNKRCLMGFKDKSPDELLTLKEAKQYDEYAGILAEDTILIDIDDYDKDGNLKYGVELSDILLNIVDDLQLNCRVYKTSRGMHFLFKNKDVNKCDTGVNLACGIIADIKVGSRNSYSILKFNGVERKVLYDIYEDEEYQVVPKFLQPVPYKTIFALLGEGDGRNDALFKYILALQGAGYTKEECKEALTIMNKYVLAQPLSERELKTIMRNDSFKKEVFYNDRTFLFHKFAHYIKNNAYIRKINKALHIYKDGIYVNGYSYIEQEMIRHIPSLKAKDRTEVLKYLELIVEPIKMSDARFIAFANGIYDIVTDKMIDFDPAYVITNKIPWDYVPGAYSEIADKALNKLACNEDDTRQLLEEAIGYAFWRRNELRKSFMLVGDKKNGKSTYLNMINNVVGDDNAANLDVNEIGDKFLTAELFGTLVNIGDDIDKKYNGHTGYLKKLISGSKVQAQKKGRDPFKLVSYTKYYFSANKIPRFDDSTGALLDRFIIIPFNATFSPDDEDFDPYIKYKLEAPEVMEYLIAIGVEGLKRVLKTNTFTMTEAVKRELKEFDEQNNPINFFFEEFPIDTILNHTTGDIYIKYDLWCRNNGCKPCNNYELGRRIKTHYGLVTKVKRIDGKSVRVYALQSVTKDDEM